MSRNSVIGDLFAEAQLHYGLFTRAQAASLGIDAKRLVRMGASGLIERHAESVFRVAAVPSSWEQRALAAVWIGGRHCYVTANTAARLWGTTDRRATQDDTIHLLVEASRRKIRVPNAVVHSTTKLLPQDTCVVRAIPSTDPIRTWLMQAAMVPEHAVEQLLDEAEREGRLVRSELVERLKLLRVQGRDGTGVAARILESREIASSLPASVLERRFVRLLKRYQLPMGVGQYQIRRADGRQAFIDYAWPDLACGAELDGHAYHATRAERRADNVRQREVQNAGFELIRFTWEEVTKSPEIVAGAVRKMLLRRESEVLRYSQGHS